jgi:hypothetical protein
MIIDPWQKSQEKTFAGRNPSVGVKKSKSQQK